MNRFILLFLGIGMFACKSDSKKSDFNSILISSDSCSGTYEGLEFVNGSDVAHQFSNTMCETIGDKLKELYNAKHYSKVDFSNIEMSTQGMGSNRVIYKLVIPFMRVENKCDAMTSFDHCGGWNHSPALESRKKQLQSALMQGEELSISELKTTPEGLQEYWIQWKSEEFQSDCTD